jgi:hypothetical protein
METIVFIGGIGSNRSQVEAVGQELSDYYSQPVQVFSFRDAWQNRKKVKDLTQGAHVITHSAGMATLGDANPKEIVAIAPPIPTQPSTLIWRSVPKTIQLVRHSRDNNVRRQKVREYHRRAMIEHSRYPQYNLGYLARVGRFDAFKAGQKMASNGTAVTLAFMQDDLLFFNTARFYFVNEMSEHGIDVRLDIPGEHDEFLLYPISVIERLSSLSQLNS